MTIPDHPTDEYIRRLPLVSDEQARAMADDEAKRALYNQIVATPPYSAQGMRGTAESDDLMDEVAARPRRARVLAVAVGVAVVATTLAVGPGLISDSSSRAFALRQLPNGVLEIDVSSQFRDGHALAAELGEYGVEIDVRTLTASPSLVGEVTVDNQTGGDYIPEGLSIPEDGEPQGSRWTIDPHVLREPLTIEIAVAPGEDEAYTMSAEVFEPGEVLGGLHCALGEPVRAEDVAPYVEELELTPIWEVVSPSGRDDVTTSTRVEDIPQGEILSGYAVDDTTVRFNVRLDGVSLPDGWEPQLSHTPCTAEQAASWQ